MTEGEEKKTVLAVDDEAQLLKLMRRSIGKFANVLTASNPDEAIAIMAEERFRLNGVISDLDMSGYESADGIRVITAAKNLGIEKRILVSGRAGEPGVNEAAIEARATEAFNKNDRGLIQKIKSLFTEENEAESSTDS